MGIRPQQSSVNEDDEELLGCRTMVSGQSGSTSRSSGMPSTGTAAGDNAALKLNHLDIQDDAAASQGVVASKKKREVNKGLLEVIKVEEGFTNLA
ncbi:hypothetical protein RYX36_021050 [Vicia faba]